jgi:hypothetical protein
MCILYCRSQLNVGAAEFVPRQRNYQETKTSEMTDLVQLLHGLINTLTMYPDRLEDEAKKFSKHVNNGLITINAMQVCSELLSCLGSF